MKKQLLKLLSMLIVTTATWAQPKYDLTKISREKLNRGLVAVRTQDGRVTLSWRTLGSDKKGELFDIYRDGVKLNTQPLTSGGTFFIDEQAPKTSDIIYEVRGGNQNGSFTLKVDAPADYLPIPIQKPEGGTTPDGRSYQYSANDCSVGDVDGDGQYEIFLKWDPSNARDNAHDGFTGPVLIDCYRLNGEHLWRINLGRNIRAGAHYTQFMVYDFDGDGRAELMVKTGDGTIDGRGNVVGDSTADYRQRPDVQQAETAWNGQQEWSRYNRGQRTKVGRILTGPEYLSVFNGLTGEVMDTKPYVPERGDLNGWGDAYANRSDRFLAAVAYLDGIHASGVFCRGYYTRTVIAAWDWDGKELKYHWTFDTNQPEWRSYAGQGNHNLRVADVDGDGCDEITYGSMCVDHNGQGLYNTGFGHGDALHLIADPKDGQLYIWDCHENKRDGSDLRNARTGGVVFQIPSKSDVGRCMAADIDPTNPGVEMWSSDSHGIRTMKGDVLSSAKDADNPQHDNTLQLNGRRLSVNFGIWWDGDLLRELLDRETVSKYDWESRSVIDIMKFEGAQFNNGTKSNPCLQADILGDWREEVLVRTPDSRELRLYTTTIPTSYRINCLMEDIPYRLSVAAENVAYNQPPEAGYYIGPDRTDYVKN
ncbi:MAG: rhamnogalacturonan lyase [Prevotella sp.]|nr:rhamnogalacturonan lyase [Prevotella sp.]